MLWHGYTTHTSQGPISGVLFFVNNNFKTLISNLPHFNLLNKSMEATSLSLSLSLCFSFSVYCICGKSILSKIVGSHLKWGKIGLVVDKKILRALRFSKILKIQTELVFVWLNLTLDIEKQKNGNCQLMVTLYYYIIFVNLHYIISILQKNLGWLINRFFNFFLLVRHPGPDHIIGGKTIE